MSIGVVIDAACDLPRAFIERHGVTVLPVTLEFGDKTLADVRDPSATRSFYRTYLAERDFDASTRAADPETIRDIFLENLVLNYDRVLVLCMSRTRGHVYDNATEASYAILQGYRQRRADAGVAGSFALRVFDSRTLFSGQALLAYEAVGMATDGRSSFDQVRQSVEELRPQVQSFLVPRDLYFLRKRARKKGDKSIDFLSYHVGRTLDIKPTIHMNNGESRTCAKHRGFEQALKVLFSRTLGAMQVGLAAPVIAMSYGGDPLVIQEMQAYKEFATVAAARNVKLLFSVMSATAGVNVGPGAFSLSYAGSF